MADAGLSMDEVDGLASFADDRNEATFAAADLGLAELRYATMSWLPGGGGACAAVANAAMAVETGACEVVVVYRSLCQGQFHRFGQGPGGRPSQGTGPRVPGVRKARTLLEAHLAFTMPFGMFSPPIAYAMVLQRHMHLFGTTAEQMGQVAVTTRAHAARNPRAVMGDRPMTMDDYLASRFVSEPFRLFDCCLENDGACAVVVTTAERARDLARTPVEIVGSAQGTPRGFGHGQYSNVSMPDDDYTSAGARTVAARLWASAGLGPTDIDVAQIYDHFTGLVLLESGGLRLLSPGRGRPLRRLRAFSPGPTALCPPTPTGALSPRPTSTASTTSSKVSASSGATPPPRSTGPRPVSSPRAAGVPTSALVLGRP